MYGQYYQTNSVFHRMSAHYKIIGVMAFALLIFYLPWWLSATMLAICLYFARIPARRWFRQLRPLFFFILLLFLINVIFTELSLAIIIVARLLLLFIAATFLSLTTTPLSLLRAAKKLLSPLKRLNIPTDDLALMIMLVPRLLTILSATAKIIKDAQRARGLTCEFGNWRQKIKKHTLWVQPLLLASFRNANVLAMAISARSGR